MRGYVCVEEKREEREREREREREIEREGGGGGGACQINRVLTILVSSDCYGIGDSSVSDLASETS